jgi:uncharacterized phage protein (TIGR01671 family)
MGREIKFRGRRVDNDKWVYGQYFKTPLTDENSGTTPDAGWFFLSGSRRHCIVQDGVSFVIDEKTVSEYTGLKDKNDVEIYEGDVVEVCIFSPYDKPFKSAVKWIAYMGGWFFDNGYNIGIVSPPNSAKVIGNIYENGTDGDF